MNNLTLRKSGPTSSMVECKNNDPTEKQTEKDTKVNEQEGISSFVLRLYKHHFSLCVVFCLLFVSGPQTSGEQNFQALKCQMYSSDECGRTAVAWTPLVFQKIFSSAVNSTQVSFRSVNNRTCIAWSPHKICKEYFFHRVKYSVYSTRYF